MTRTHTRVPARIAIRLYKAGLRFAVLVDGRVSVAFAGMVPARNYAVGVKYKRPYTDDLMKVEVIDVEYGRSGEVLFDSTNPEDVKYATAVT